MKVFVVVPIWIMIFSLFASADITEGTRGGGDIVEIKAKTLIQVMGDHSLNQIILRYVEALKLNLSSISDRDVQATLTNMFSHDLEKDIQESHYVPKDFCPDGADKGKSASTGMGDFGGEICFNLQQIVDEHTSFPDFMGLVLHEHSHHFGCHLRAADEAKSQGADPTCNVDPNLNPGYDEDHAYALSKAIAVDVLLKTIRQEFASNPEDDKLMSSLVGKTLHIIGNMESTSVITIQDGNVYYGNNPPLHDGVWCELYGFGFGTVLKKGDYRITGEQGDWSSNLPSGSSTDTDLFFNRGTEIGCVRRPDAGAKVKASEFIFNVRGIMEVK